MPSEQLTLVIDQGTHATRAFAFDSIGRVLGSTRCAIALHRISADVIEQDPEEIVDSLQEVLRDLFADSRVRRQGFAQAALATQRSSVVAWDRGTGKALSPVISWQDRRAAGWLSQFETQNEQIKEKTGLPLSPHYGASKLRWLLDNEPRVQRAQHEGTLAMGPLAGFLIFHLLDTQRLQVDHANAARTQLWELDGREWDPWLLSLFGVPGEHLPACRPIRHDYGLVKDTGIPLVVANGDQNAAVYGLGQPPKGVAIVNIGTGAFILHPTGTRLLRHPQLLCGLASSDEEMGEYTIEGTVNGAGAALTWATKAWNMPEIIDKLVEWLARPGEPPIFLNTIGGLGSPWWRSGPEPTIIGPGEPWQQAVAVVESILFLLQANLEAMVAAGQDINSIRVSGGLAQLDGICQRLADLSGYPVYRPAEVEATARGAAWLAAGKPDYWPETRPGQTFDPRPNPALQGRHRRFLSHISGTHDQAQVSAP